MEEHQNQRSFFSPGLSRTLGLFCAGLLVLLGLWILPEVLRGDWPAALEKLRISPGAEPFLIFFFPVILVVGAAWLAKWGKRGCRKFFKRD